MTSDSGVLSDRLKQRLAEFALLSRPSAEAMQEEMQALAARRESDWKQLAEQQAKRLAESYHLTAEAFISSERRDYQLLEVELKRRHMEAQRLQAKAIMRDQFLKPLLDSMKTLGENGWAIHGHFTVPDVKAAAQTYRNHGQAAGDNWFCEYHRVDNGQNLRFLHSKLLSATLSRWRTTIDEVLWAAENGRYNLVVYASFPVLEAAVAEAVGKFGSRNTKVLKMWKSVNANSDDDLCFLSIETFLDVVWGDWSFDQKPPSLVNRHAGSHRATQTYSETDALRLLTAVAAVADYKDRLLGK